MPRGTGLSGEGDPTKNEERRLIGWSLADGGVAVRLVILLLVAVAFPSVPLGTRINHAVDPTAAPNDNETPAGTRVGDTLLLRLTVSPAAWHLLGDSNAARRVAAFGEEGKAPTIPAPLIRVRVGTPIHARSEEHTSELQSRG